MPPSVATQPELCHLPIQVSFHAQDSLCHRAELSAMLPNTKSAQLRTRILWDEATEVPMWSPKAFAGEEECKPPHSEAGGS